MTKRSRDELGKRMKEYYEQVPKTRLMRRTPVAIRIDGKAFHTYARNFRKPFDDVLMKAMQQTMLYLCQNIQGCVVGYTQSDEITLILCDYQTLATSAWYDYEVQKLCSVSASMATMAFNKAMSVETANYKSNITKRNAIDNEELTYMKTLESACAKGAMFDARCFNIPIEEVTNLLYWRQLDASKNSVQMLGRTYFSAKDLHGKHSGEIQDMLMETYKVNWNNLPVPAKRGSCCIHSENGWEIDNGIPEFKGDGRLYIERRIHFDD